MAKLLEKSYYETDRSLTGEIEARQKKVRAAHFEKLVNSCKNTLISMEIFAESKPPKRKVYLNAILDAKMMSEAEVKEEQYREHF